MVKFRIVGFTLGILLTLLGVCELIPAIVDLGNSDNAFIFLESALFSFFFGGALILSFRGSESKITLRESFLLTTMSWVFLSFFSAFPLYWSDLDISFTDAFFETVSGITTTGSTVLSGLDSMSRGILLWRSMIQWIGGIGIIGFAIVFLPFLRIGGMQLFKMESSDKSDKIMPRTAEVAGGVMSVYIGFTCIFAFVYYYLGMSSFDAINHAMTTIATGGYSTHDKSFGFFESYSLDMAGTFFMFMSGIPFMLYVRWVFQGKFVFHKDEQVIAYSLIVAVLAGTLSLWLWFNAYYSPIDAFRYATFHLISMITTTGYATTDYLLWGPFSVAFFLFVTYLGACAGSTSGGVKTMRLVVAFKAIGRNINKMPYPNGVFPLRYQGKTLSDQDIIAIMGFIGLFVVSNIIFTLSLAFMGLDFATAVSAVATSVANVGPGIGDIIGPAGNFSSLPDAAKWILGICMIIGRLEILTVTVLFLNGFWWDKS